MSIHHQLAWSPVKKTCNTYRILFTFFFQQTNNAETCIASIGQAIMQNTFPNLILAPLQLGLGLQIHQQFGSKFLIESLYSQGFSLSYAEILRFERCTAAYHGTNIPDLAKHQNYSMQALTDNVDRNAKIMDGENTFHGMGIIVAITPCLKSTAIILRQQDFPSADLLKLAEIESQKLIPTQQPKAYIKV